VYTLAFLAVMALFALGNMLLKLRRRRLPRAVRAGWPTVVLAFVAVVVGLVGNVLLDPASVQVFSVYLAATGGIVAVMFLRLALLRGALRAVRGALERLAVLGVRMQGAVQASIQGIQSRSVVYFTPGDAPAQLNRAALYVLENEQTDRLAVVHLFEDPEGIPDQLATQLSTIDHLYPELRIDFIAVRGRFGPELISALSERLGVPRNYMFIGTPSASFGHRVEELGGVRLIL